jgi:hypothetical protein
LVVLPRSVTTVSIAATDDPQLAARLRFTQPTIQASCGVHAAKRAETITTLCQKRQKPNKETEYVK